MTTQDETSAIASACRTIRTEQDALGQLHDALSGEMGAPFAAAIESIVTSKGRVIIVGIGKSGHVGRKIAATLASTGTPAYFVHPAEASHGDLGMIMPEDVILALSWSGETTELGSLIGYAARFNVKLIAITAGQNSTLGEAADILLALPRVTEACPNGLAPTSSTTMQLALGDALAVALLEARGFTAQDFRVYHPGGKLGAALRHVRDLMHKDTELPVVPSGMPMREAIIEITAKRFGCAAIVGKDGKLEGIITDGDVRRAIERDLLSASVDAVMSRTPRTITPERLAAEAIEIMNAAKITVLIVVENARPVGIVHLHDLLRAGVA
jgi:arabinose-5-phosphate isomerase